jgi:hypothetical protein
MHESDLESLGLSNAVVYRAVAQRRWKQGISENEALEKGLKEKSTEFIEKGSDAYAKA